MKNSINLFLKNLKSIGKLFFAAVDLIWKFCLNVKFKSLFEIYVFFPPILDNNCCSFKIVKKHYLKFVETKENCFNTL